MKVFNHANVPIKLWAKTIEDSAMEQLNNVANHPAIFHHVAAMPDCHTGYGLIIGGVAALENCISPNMVGMDVSCGMMACRTSLTSDLLTKDVLKDIVNQIKRDVPMGCKHQSQISEERTKTAEEIVSKYFEIID